MQNDKFTIENSILKAYWGFNHEVIVPDGVTSIGGNIQQKDKGRNIEGAVSGYKAFYNNCFLESVIIPESTNIIGFKSFQGCKNLSKITIKGIVKKVEANAFSGCSSIREILWGGSIQEFKDCKFLYWFPFEQSIIIHCNDGSVTSKDVWYECNMVIEDDKVKSFSTTMKIIKIPEGIKVLVPTEILNYSDTEVEELFVPKSVERIDDFTLSYCTKLKRLHIFSTLKEIGYAATKGCDIEEVFYDGSIFDLEQLKLKPCNGNIHRIHCTDCDLNLDDSFFIKELKVPYDIESVKKELAERWIYRRTKLIHCMDGDIDNTK